MPVRTKRVRLPRPKGARKGTTAQLVLTMHPRQLAAIEARARATSMSLTAYVLALLDSDLEDIRDLHVIEHVARVRTGARSSPFGVHALVDDASLIGAGLTSVVVAVPDVDPCPRCAHPEAFHGERVSGALGCDVEGCSCSITPAQWRAETGA